MSIGSPFLLVTLLVPALALAAYVWIERRPGRYAVSFPNLSVLAGVARGSGHWRRHLTAALLVTSIALLCVGVARPHMALMVPSEQATVIVTLDVSGSMQAEDIKPTRLDAAKEAVGRFLDRVPDQMRVGLVLFSSETYVAAPPTRDRDALRSALEYALPQAGTAIGDAVARSAELASQVTTPPVTAEDEQGAAGTGTEEEDPAQKPLAAVVFLSDGFQTRGVLTPEEGTERAVEAKIPVHTIALGTDSGVIETERYGERRIIPVPPDRPTLKAIADSTGGNAFEVRDAERLVDVYDSLGSSIGRVEEDREVTAAFVGAGAVLLGAAGLFAGLWAPRLP
jgi:Ca-activated chloride channel family protein